MGYKPSTFSRCVGGPRSAWTIATLTEAWAVHSAIVETDPNDLEQYYAAGLAMQMAGEEGCDDQYMKFCKAAEVYHISITAAVEYYLKIATDMEAAGEDEAINQDLYNIKGRIKLLTRYQELKVKEAKTKCTVS